MKSTVSCEIIEDLLPLYLDDICSQASKDLVEEHLSSCQKCRLLLETMRQSDEKTALLKDDSKRIVSRHRKKELFSSVNEISKRFFILALCTLLLLAFFGASTVYSSLLQAILQSDVGYAAQFDQSWSIGRRLCEVEERYGALPGRINEQGNGTKYLAIGQEDLYCFIYFEDYIAVKTEISGWYGG